MPLSGVSTKLACSALRLILAPDTSPDGEFGPTYVDTDTKGHEEINAQRYELLQEQLRLYDTYPNISWTVWCWKDIGICGVVHPNPDSKYMKLIKPFLEHKKVCTRRSAGLEVGGVFVLNVIARVRRLVGCGRVTPGSLVQADVGVALRRGTLHALQVPQGVRRRQGQTPVPARADVSPCGGCFRVSVLPIHVNCEWPPSDLSRRSLCRSSAPFSRTSRTRSWTPLRKAFTSVSPRPPHLRFDSTTDTSVLQTIAPPEQSC
jgi:hypothetical protein